MRIEAVQGDITEQVVDAIVNAANSTLLGGGGVDGAIHAAAGPRLLSHCRALRRGPLVDGLPVGDAVATPAGRLPARWVVHTVGPNAHAGETDPAQLASCFTRSLDVAAGLGARSVAFPAVSAGAYGWDVDDVARVAVDAVRGWVAERAARTRPPVVEAVDEAAVDGAGGVDLVRFVLFDRAAMAAFRARLQTQVTP